MYGVSPYSLLSIALLTFATLVRFRITPLPSVHPVDYFWSDTRLENHPPPMDTVILFTTELKACYDCVSFRNVACCRTEFIWVKNV